MISTPARPRGARSILALILTLLVALAGVLVAPAPAHAAEGDVAGATLNWGVKASFRNYLGSPIAHGGWTVTGGIAAATPFAWTGGTGTASAADATGAVSYPGSIHFTGHQVAGSDPVAYALDLMLSEVRVVRTGTGTANLVVDARGNSQETPAEFVTHDDIVFATLDLAAAVAGTTEGVVSYSNAPAVLTAAGAEAFAGFYGANTALDPVSFSWPVEGAPVVEPPVREAPAVEVSQATELNAEGQTITVRGTGFGPDGAATNGTRPPLAGTFGGAYVVFGKFADTWKPSASAPSSARVGFDTKFVILPENVGAPRLTEADGAVGLAADGSFEVELTVSADEASELLAGNYGVYTYPGSGSTYAAFETYTPLSFGAAVVTPPVVDPPVVPAPVAAGSLNWGIKESFRSYVSGPIARGSISTSGVGTSGGAFVFGQASGGSYTPDAGVGSSNYSGSVRFTGHEGALDVTLANPVVTVASAGSGTLSVTANGSRVVIASLNLGAGTRSTQSGAVRYSGVPATLTAAGAGVFALEGSPFYPSGTALDPVSFTIGAPSSGGAGSAVVASYVAPTVNTPAATPPATTGITVEGGVDGLSAGATVSISAEGFQPGETGILVVIYSEPTVLDSLVTADAAGRASWTGALPLDLTGEHTLTLQGSVDRGVVLDLASAVRTASLVGCTVTDASLDWGFKEAFRAYVSGTIAKGEWVVSDGASYDTPLFSWHEGTGGYDAETGAGELAFAGAVTFTGHGGILNTTVSSPRIELVDANTGYLVLDISGDTQAGESVDAQAVRFAQLNLAAGTLTADGSTVSFADVPATLTAEGSAAFGTYETGTALDPIALTLTLDPVCGEVALPVAGPGEVTPISAASDLGWMLWVGIGVLVLLVAGLVLLLVRRRRA